MFATRTTPAAAAELELLGSMREHEFFDQKPDE